MDSIKVILKKMFAQKLKMRRKEMGFITQKDLADHIAIDESRISRWESGRFLPGPEYWPKLISSLGLTEAYFIGELRQPESAQSLGKMLDEKDREIAALKRQIKERPKGDIMAESELATIKKQLKAYKKVPDDLIRFLAKEKAVTAALAVVIRGNHLDDFRESVAEIAELDAASGDSKD